MHNIDKFSKLAQDIREKNSFPGATIQQQNQSLYKKEDI